MSRPTPATVAAATIGGLANVAVVLVLYGRAGYPAFESISGMTPLAVTAFALGFVPVLVTAHTRLVAPAVGLLAVLAGTAYVELTSPAPEWGERSGHVIVEGPTHVASYANTWYVWLAMLLVAAVVEFAIRRGYGVGNRRLRHLPDLPLPRDGLAWFVAGSGALVGGATTLLVLRSGIRPPLAATFVFVAAAAVTAVPLAALLARGILSPVVLFALLVPYFLTVEVFVTTDSPVHILFFGPYAIVLALAWALEALVRSHLEGWDGGRFAGRNPS